jgi:catechol 2,3-dioxygenase-like lactoylglutathione lyase family enzyme
MPEKTEARTAGVDHVGLAVADLNRSRAFFTDCLGWQQIGERPEYPAAFVSDGHSRITLWQVADPATCQPFDRRRNVGLHHLALKVPGRAQLDALHARVAAWPGVTVEFAPQLSGAGPKWHSMIREPGGCRIEFAWDPR